MREQSRRYPITLLCQTMQVDRRGYYRWLSKHDTPALGPFIIKRNRYTALVKQAFADEKGKVGARSIINMLHAQGHQIGSYRVRSIMRENSLVCRIRRRYKASSRSVNNSLIFTNSAIRPTEINRLWVTDITYIKTLSGCRYLSVILDAYSRRVLGFRLANHMQTDLVIDTLSQCLRINRIPTNVTPAQ